MFLEGLASIYWPCRTITFSHNFATETKLMLSLHFISASQFFQDSPNTEDESSDGYIGTDASEVHHRSSSRVSSILQGNLRENRLSLPNLSLYSNFSATKHGNMEVSDSEIQPIRAPGGKSSRCKSSSRKQGRLKSNDKKQAASKKAAKNSKSSPSLRRSAPPTKSGGAKLSKSLTSLRSLEQAGPFKAGAEEYWDRLDALRSSMSISQMTIQSQTESGQLPLGTTENVYPDVDNVSPEVYITMSARTKRVQPFQQIAHPDMLGHVSPKWKEFLYERPVKAQRWVLSWTNKQVGCLSQSLAALNRGWRLKCGWFCTLFNVHKTNVPMPRCKCDFPNSSFSSIK